MNIRRINPLADPRWNDFIQTHPQASVFHTPAWMSALQRTYGYQPVAYVIEDGNRIAGGLPFCKVKSFITGRRLVSLPFSDHCEPLVSCHEQLTEVINIAQADAQPDRCKYLEIRPLTSAGVGLAPSNNVVVHKLDITRNQDALLRTFHADCIRRKIARAEREGLHYEEGRSADLLRDFHTLLLMTRRRHGIPPQPLRWFRNLIESFGDNLTISVASKDGVPIASILTICFNKTLVYKYGCSDEQYNALAGSIFLLWRAIQRAQRLGLAEMDLGRSDYSTPGLITFKDRWGAAKLPVQYYRSGDTKPSSVAGSRVAAAVKRLLPSMPDSMLCALGGVLYRHVG